jgi:hypothetical protein
MANGAPDPTQKQRRRPRSMIFGIGLNRTGTSSLCQAMRLLDFSAKHCVHHWEDIRTYEFTNDYPIMYLYKALDRYFGSTSRFILTIRDLDTWLASWHGFQSVLDNYRAPEENFRYKIRLGRALQRFMVYGDIDYNEGTMRTAWYRHHAEVYEYFKHQPERLLVMNIADDQDGWEKLCPWLGVDIPDIPFPHRNNKSRVSGLRRVEPELPLELGI